MQCSEELCGWVADVDDDLKMFAHAWWCGDEYCNCSQAKIETYTERDGAIFRGQRDRITIWEGTFETDGMGSPTTEINRIGRHLRTYHHDLYVRIVWPWQWGADSRRQLGVSA